MIVSSLGRWLGSRAGSKIRERAARKAVDSYWESYWYTGKQRSSHMYLYMEGIVGFPSALPLQLPRTSSRVEHLAGGTSHQTSQIPLRSYLRVVSTRAAKLERPEFVALGETESTSRQQLRRLPMRFPWGEVHFLNSAQIARASLHGLFAAKSWPMPPGELQALLLCCISMKKDLSQLSRAQL